MFYAIKIYFTRASSHELFPLMKHKVYLETGTYLILRLDQCIQSVNVNN